MAERRKLVLLWFCIMFSRTERALHFLLWYLQTFSMFIYSHVITNIDMPYYLFYLTVIRALSIIFNIVDFITITNDVSLNCLNCLHFAVVCILNNPSFRSQLSFCTFEILCINWHWSRKPQQYIVLRRELPTIDWVTK